MKYIKKFLKWTGILILVLLLVGNLAIVFSGRYYIYKGISNTYFRGHIRPTIYDLDVFKNRSVEIGEPQPWEDHEALGSFVMSAEQRETVEALTPSSFLVAWGDTLIYEEYWGDHDQEQISNSFSMAKSVVSLLVGVALEEGKIKSLDEPVANYLPEFEGDKKNITIRHILTMSSGLSWSESYVSPFCDVAELYYDTDDRDLALNRRTIEEDPGNIFNYKSGDTQVLMYILNAATGSSVSEYASEKLWSKIGAESEAMQQHTQQQHQRQQYHTEERSPEQHYVQEHNAQEFNTPQYAAQTDNVPRADQSQNNFQQESLDRPSHDDRTLAFEDPQKATITPVSSTEPQDLSAESTQEMHQMRDELQQLRGMINSQLGNVAWGDFSYRHPVSAAIFKRLVKMGLSSSLSRSLSQQVDSQASKKEAWHKVLVDLSSRVPVFDSIPKKEGRIAFVGPAGVGKTTTIAKLAAEYVLAHGPENLALVTTDSYRIAGHEQLRVLSKILKVPLRIVAGNQSLESALRGLNRKKMVLIDTAGLSHKDCAWEEQISQLTSATTPIKKWLVLSATSQQRILDKAVMDYKTLGLDGCVLTKLDESASLGEALNVAIEHQLSVAYTTNGQNIPDDIEQAKSRNLVNQAIALTKQATIDDELAADCFNESIRTDNGEFTAA